MRPLRGHVSESTAFVIESYPYSFTLRCQKKVWIETAPKHGQRIVEMTSNPKYRGPGTKYNAPKKSTYSNLCGAFMVEASDVDGKKYTADEIGHVRFFRIGDGGSVEALERYYALFGPFETEYEVKTMRDLLARARARDSVAKWEEENPAPPYGYPITAEERDAYNAWSARRNNKLAEFLLIETSRIRASDEVPMPQTAPVAPAQEVVPAGAMF